MNLSLLKKTVITVTRLNRGRKAGEQARKINREIRDKTSVSVLFFLAQRRKTGHSRKSKSAGISTRTDIREGGYG